MARILIADDDMAGLAMRRLMLEGAGHQVSLAMDPPGVLRQMEQAYDLLIIDLRFLNCAGIADCREGLNLIRKIRNSERDVPIIVLSGWPADLDDRPEQEMVSKVMLKPVMSRDLLAAIDQLVPRK